MEPMQPPEPVRPGLPPRSTPIPQPGGFPHLTGELNPQGTRDYPGEAILLAEVEAACDDGFEPYIGLAYEESVFEVYYLYPRAFGWKPERGIYFCFVGEIGKATIGSVYQSER